MSYSIVDSLSLVSFKCGCCHFATIVYYGTLLDYKITNRYGFNLKSQVKSQLKSISLIPIIIYVVKCCVISGTV